ncbi:RNA pseudouridylate synthase domain-containing protein 2-like isoform X1 [Contarinia nasturtii]|uniref:RNA pseudouridylate synthase domain-containing protein 2-like isoform X1 n=1 Tax=Contarinia nasturtii TaxID=265458 RepID=UPI0012D4954A|nr:RNA pseudouridylate synthase domain-containing protein 2-like isoform X1 [Contarinia nasturtii]
MQHHPGSAWYMPWGVPLQKMALAVPFHPTVAAVGYHHQTQQPGVQVAAGPTTQHQQQQHTPSHHQTYQTHQMHPATAALHQQLQHHHPAAAAMFTPLSLRTFISPTPNHMNLGQQALTNVGSLVAAQHQQPHQQMPPTQQTQAQTRHHQATSGLPPTTNNNHTLQSHSNQSQLNAINLNVGCVPLRQPSVNNPNGGAMMIPVQKILMPDKEKTKLVATSTEKRKADDIEIKDLKKAKLETKALKAKRPGFTDERYHETSYYIENGLRKVYPYYFTFTTFTKGRWVGEKILDVFAREFRAHPAEEYERCIKAGTLTVNYEKVPIDCRLKHNDLLANIVHRHEVPVTSQPITIVHMDDDIVVVNKPASIPVHPCGRYRHNTVVFILAKEFNLKNLRTIHRLDRLTSGLLLFGRSPKKARQMEHQIRNRQVQKQYMCRVEGDFPDGIIECKEPIEVVSYKIGVCKVSPKGKDCMTIFQKLGYNGKTSVVLCKPRTGRMHQIRVHLQFLGYPVVNDPLYNHEVFGPLKGRGGDIGGKTDEELVRDLINIHNAENWLGIDGDSELSLFKTLKAESDDGLGSLTGKGTVLSDDDSESVSREASPCSESPRPVSLGSESPVDNSIHAAVMTSTSMSACSAADQAKVTVATQTGHDNPDFTFNPDKMTVDKHCYECKVRYRDPKPQDLVMYLHAWKYQGPGWEYETPLPEWAKVDWVDYESE